MAAAIEAFNEKGYHGASVRDIAGRVGVTVPTLYYHHGDKQGLLVEPLEASIREIIARVKAADDEAEPNTVHRFVNAVQCVVLFLANRRQLAWLASQRRYLDPERGRPYKDLRGELEDHFRELILRGVAQGHFRTRHVDDVVRALLGMYQAIADWYSPDGPLSAEAVASRYVEMSLSLVKAIPSDREVGLSIADRQLQAQ